jgi:hypothetical protein
MIARVRTLMAEIAFRLDRPGIALWLLPCRIEPPTAEDEAWARKIAEAAQP